MEPSNAAPPSMAVSDRNPVPASSIRVGVANGSARTARQEVCPP